MKPLKFNLEEFEKLNTGFSYYILGRSYDLEENGAEENFEKALEYYTKGFKLNYPLCIYSLGISYYLGLGNVLPVNKEMAEKLLIKAYPLIQNMISDETLSEEERLYAKFVTGAYYNWGLGNVEQDDEKAFIIIKECADSGHIAAIYDLGYKFYREGVGTEKNLTLSKKYLSIAKNSGLKRAITKYNEYQYDNKEWEK